MTFHRAKSWRLNDDLTARTIETFVIDNKDRLCRFGFALLDPLAESRGGHLAVMNDETLSPEQATVEGMMAATQCCSVHLDGLRSYKKKLASALEQDAESTPNSAEPCP